MREERENTQTKVPLLFQLKLKPYFADVVPLVSDVIIYCLWVQ